MPIASFNIVFVAPKIVDSPCQFTIKSGDTYSGFACEIVSSSEERRKKPSQVQLYRIDFPMDTVHQACRSAFDLCIEPQKSVLSGVQSS